METRRRSARTAGKSCKRKAEEEQEAPEEKTQLDTCPEEPPGEERTVTELSSDQCVEKENQVNTTDTNQSKRSKTCESSGAVPLGKPKSGRVWKDRNKQRFSALLRDKPLRTSWQKKMEAKREKDLVKQYHQQLKDQQAKEKEEKRKRREENLQRREANERKAEVVQVISNTAKLKRMKKKQLRKIEKRDTLSALQKTPPAVKKAGK